MADRAMTRLDRIIERVTDKLPREIDLDDATLLTMGLAGTSVYLMSGPIIKQFMTMRLMKAAALEKKDGLSWMDAWKILFEPGSVYRWWASQEFGFDILTGQTELTEEELEDLLQAIAEYEPPEEMKVALALGAGALAPQTGAILQGLGDILEGLIPF